MISSLFIRKTLFVLFWFLTPIEVWAAIPTKPVEVRLESEVKVSGDSVVLGDVATIYAKSMHDFQALSELVLAKVGDGGELKLPQGYLESRIREVLPKGTEFKLHSARQITFRLDRIGISTEELLAEITRKAKAEGKVPEWAELEVQAVGGFEQLKIGKIGEARIEPAAEMPRWKGDLAFKIFQPGKDLVWVKVKMRWFANAWVAKRALGIFTAVNAGDFAPGRVEVTSLREDPMPATQEIESVLQNARARRSIAAGAPLVSAALERAPDAKSGQAMRVVFVSESGVRVSTEGALLGAGSIGNEVRVKLRSSRKVVTGRLVSGNLMEVSL